MSQPEEFEENCEVGSYKTWYARVRFQDDEVTDVSVKKIKIMNGEPFKPSSLDDFDPHSVYSVKTSKYDSEGKAQRYFAFIGRMAVSEAALEEDSRRIRWPSRWPVDLNEEPNNTSQDEGLINHAAPVETQKQKALLRSKKKNTQNGNTMQKFLSSSALKLQGPSDSVVENVDQESSFACSCQNNQLNLKSLNELIEERDKLWKSEMSKMIAEAVSGAVAEHFSKLDEKLCKFQLSTSVFVEEWIQHLP